MSQEPLTYTSYIATTPEHVWRALTSPEITQRYFDFIEGFMRVKSAWTPGTEVSYSTGGTEAQIEGEVIAAEPPSRLLTTFSLRYDSEVRAEPPTRLSWEITPMGEVGRLTMTHDQLQDSPRTAHDLSICMPSTLSNLKVLLETGRPRLIKAIVVDCAVPAVGRGPDRRETAAHALATKPTLPPRIGYRSPPTATSKPPARTSRRPPAPTRSSPVHPEVWLLQIEHNLILIAEQQYSVAVIQHYQPCGRSDFHLAFPN